MNRAATITIVVLAAIALLATTAAVIQSVKVAPLDNANAILSNRLKVATKANASLSKQAKDLSDKNADLTMKNADLARELNWTKNDAVRPLYRVTWGHKTWGDFEGCFAHRLMVLGAKDQSSPNGQVMISVDKTNTLTATFQGKKYSCKAGKGTTEFCHNIDSLAMDIAKANVRTRIIKED